MNNDPADLARQIASFVKSNHLDGVDVDYEEVRKVYKADTGSIEADRSLYLCAQFDTFESGRVSVVLCTL
jgi:hypothetical protein